MNVNAVFDYKPVVLNLWLDYKEAADEAACVWF